MPDGEPILRIEALSKYYDTSEGFIDTLLGRSMKVKAVDGVSLDLHEGETLGVVGESGCGKTTLGRAALQLLDPTDGSVYYKGEDLTEASESRMRELRTDLQYIFQDPFASLNPRLTVGDIIGEPLDIHDIASGAARQERIRDLLETVGLNASHANRYPHEFSGGQRQRIGIARALAVDPEVIVCDEPVSALDVSVQAQILNLLEDLQDEFDLSYIFIAHDLSVVEHISDRIAVMYLGEVAELGTTPEIFAEPHHPYTEALLSAIPEPDPGWEGDQIFLTGTVPSPINPPTGCRFHTRCPRVIPPDDFDLEQSVWRSVLDLKLRLRSADSLESVTAVTEDADGNGRPDAHETVTTDGHETERIDPHEVARDELDDLVRAEFGLPDRLGDREAEEILQETVDQLDDEDLEAASEEMAAFESPCESTHPDLYRQSDTHEIACLLYDDDVDATPDREWAVDEGAAADD